MNIRFELIHERKKGRKKERKNIRFELIEERKKERKKKYKS